MTPTLATICFESAYLLCHVNAIDAHPMRIQFDSLLMRIETGLHVNAPLYTNMFIINICKTVVRFPVLDTTPFVLCNEQCKHKSSQHRTGILQVSGILILSHVHQETTQIGLDFEYPTYRTKLKLEFLLVMDTSILPSGLFKNPNMNIFDNTLLREKMFSVFNY